MLRGSVEQHIKIIEYLISIGKKYNGIRKEKYTKELDIVITTFLLNQLSTAGCILHLDDSSKYFPVQDGLVLLRQFLEANITLRYICLDNSSRPKEYLEYQQFLKYNSMRNIKERYEVTKGIGWKEFLGDIINTDINEKEYIKLKEIYSINAYFGKKWSKINLKTMAYNVDYIDDYEIVYRELCSYSHADVKVSAYFIHLLQGEDQKEYKALLFCNLARYLYDVLLLVSEYSEIEKDEIEKCWDILRCN